MTDEIFIYDNIIDSVAQKYIQQICFNKINGNSLPMSPILIINNKDLVSYITLKETLILTIIIVIMFLIIIQK